jgi:WD40 repeat protein
LTSSEWFIYYKKKFISFLCEEGKDLNMIKEGNVTSTKLKGHQGPVLCLAHSGTNTSGVSTASQSSAAASLLSGSEDSTSRVWDLRSNCVRASLCIKAPGAVLSVSFGPRWTDPSDSIARDGPSQVRRDYSVFLSVGNSVLGYDLRYASSPVIVEPSVDLSNVLESADEINQIAFSPPRRQRSLHLAAADDAGCVRVTDAFALSSTSSKNQRILHHGISETNMAMVTSVNFRPHCKHLELASGGTDCTVKLWDIMKPKHPISSHLIANSDAGANQVCNPPMVHTMAWSPSGRLLVAGLGDGSCCIFGVENRSLIPVSRLVDAHSGSIASVLFPAWRQDQAHVAANDRLMVTTGNDGEIAFWDLGDMLCAEGALNPSDILNLGESTLENLCLSDQPKVLSAIPHGRKPNWMVTSLHDPIFPTTVFIADTSNEITAYQMPTR